MRNQSKYRRSRGFTLIEVMIVIAIVLALSGIIAISVLGRKKEADRKLAEIDLNTMKSALKQFRFDFDRWPNEQEGLSVLWDKAKLDGEADQGKWKRYVDEPMPNDRWGTAWNYRPVSEHGDAEMYDLWSNGPDKQEGTEDDVNSWKAESADSSGTNPTGPTPETPR